jgi:hypothetical protein
MSCENASRTLTVPQRRHGDFDASEAEIERDWVRRTEDCWSEVRRVLLTREQTIE